MGDSHDEHIAGLDRVKNPIGEVAGQGAADFSAIEVAPTVRRFADARDGVLNGRDEARGPDRSDTRRLRTRPAPRGGTRGGSATNGAADARGGLVSRDGLHLARAVLCQASSRLGRP